MSSLTTALVYQPKPSAVRSRSYRHNITPSNGGTHNADGIIKIDIPCVGMGRI